MAFNPLDYLKNLIPQNTNMFGASPNANLKQMSEMGLLGGDYEDMLAKANKQSVFQGLLNAGLSYAAQPKNQGYGSALPYLAKAGLAGVQAAQTPYDQLSTNAMQTQKLQEMQRVAGDRNKTQGVIGQMIALDPNLEYLKDAPLSQQVSAINEYTKLKMTPVTDGLNLAKLNPKDFTRDSWEKYTTSGKTTDLNGITPEVQNSIDAHNAKMFYEYGVNPNTKSNDNQNGQPNQNGTQNKPQTEPEKGFRLGNNNIPNHPSNVTLSNGDVVTPRLYKQMGEKLRLPLEAEKNQVGGQNRANIELMRQHRNLIRQFVAEGGANAVTGVFDANTPAITGLNKSNMRKKLFTIVQKEFLNNYSAVKATGGGFGALSEREGERLEAMGFNLSDEQSSDQLLQQLMALDASLAKSEQRLIDGYSMEYGAMEGFNPLELQGFDSTPSSNADDDLVNKYIS